MTTRQKYLWFTDTHLLPFNRFKMLNTILDEKPAGVFLTGDISNSSYTLMGDLDFLGKRIGRPLYFVLGNHDYHFSSIHKTHQGVRELCQKHRNLIWMTEADIVPLNEEVALIGSEGWYSCEGDSSYLKWTFDWWLINEFENMPDMKSRIEAFKWLAEQSANVLSERLERALENYKTVYLLSHFTSWKEANRCSSLLSEAFWEPYNTNIPLGLALEKVMVTRKKRHLVCLMGHSHLAVEIRVSRSIECRVGKGSYYKVSDDEIIYL